MSKYLVKLSSKMISYEWWGRQWCQNIAGYADYFNRLERGRKYIRKGAVKEINIDKGLITAMVKGTRPEDYKVKIKFEPVNSKFAERVLKQIQDINSLKDGIVPDSFKSLFTVDQGLFPSMKEIKFSCSCPDCAHLCKHVAAVLYAIGSILDQEPLLLFHLRGIDVEEYLDQQLLDVTNEVLIDINGRDNDERLIGDDMLAELFGIEIATEVAPVYEEKQVSRRPVDEVRVIEIVPKSKCKKIAIAKPKRNPLEGFVIRQYLMDGSYLREYASYDEIEKYTDIGLLNVKRACVGKKQSAGGYQWRKVEINSPHLNIDSIDNIQLSGASRPVQSFDDNGNLISSYDSIAEAVRRTGINSKSIRDAAKGVQRHAGGLVWKYKDEG